MRTRTGRRAGARAPEKRFLINGHGFPNRFSARALAATAAINDKAFVHDLTASDVVAGKLPRLGVEDSSLPISLLLWGDSHAMAAAPAFDQFLKEKNLSGRQATASATAPVIGAYYKSEYTTPEGAAAFNTAVVEYVQVNRIPNVAIVGYWEHYQKVGGVVSIEKAILKTIEKLNEIGVRSYLLLQVPKQRFSPAKAVAMNAQFGTTFDSLLLKPEDALIHGSFNEKCISAIKSIGCKVIDPSPQFIDPARNHYIIEKNGASIYRDAHHLSVSGAALVLFPVLEKQLNLKTN